MIPPENSVVIESVTPEIDGGRHPIKRVVGDLVTVEADIFSHGHELVQARLLHRTIDEGEGDWHEVPMEPIGNDRWRGAFRLDLNTTYRYTIIAWRDPFLSWLAEMRKRHDAGQDLGPELLVGRVLIERAARNASDVDRERMVELVDQLAPDGPGSSLEQAHSLVEAALAKAKKGAQVVAELSKLAGLLKRAGLSASPLRRPPAEVLFSPQLYSLMTRYPDRDDLGRYDRELEVIADRVQAQYASWYEMWPRSQGTDPERSATFADMERRLREIRELGFHVVYLTPIHPIGVTNRKGPNNSLFCPPGSPGCPYAIGNEHGGHTAVEPSLGTLEEFRGFVRACREHGMEVALDIALQASPDHPWVREHPEWFNHRPDGSIRFAENPPKQYEDIYPLNFNTEDREGLWNACLDIFRFWIKEDVKIFRVDNPHTKPVQFWQWLIDDLRRTDPDLIFLSEAFTRPKMMKALAKAGFQQSYTYFTWRNFKNEIIEYFAELTQTEVANYMRGNLFTNTPDILPEILQNAPRSAFILRALLAGTLSSTWGMYNGFELCEGTPLPGKEEYLDSEKYQFKVWDWNRPGNIKRFIARLNRIRDEEPALQRYSNLVFYHTDNDNLLAYGKEPDDDSNRIVVVVNLDPHKAHEGMIELPIDELGISASETYQMHDLLSDKRYFWSGRNNFVRLDPSESVGHIFRLMRWSHREHEFDYYI